MLTEDIAAEEEKCPSLLMRCLPADVWKLILAEKAAITERTQRGNVSNVQAAISLIRKAGKMGEV